MIYSINAIKEVASCEDYARNVLGIKGFGTRFVASWRGGDDYSVEISKDHWMDFAGQAKGFEPHHGDIIDLVKVARDIDTQQAIAEVAQYYNVQPVKPEKINTGRMSFYDKKLAEGYQEVARYNYTDEQGEIKHYVARLEHPEKKKVFCQGANGKWGGLKEMKLYLYNLPAIINSPYVLVCEGEKAAQCLIDLGLPATTNVSGAGNWQPIYSQYLVGKDVIILRDNDDAGLNHAQMVAKSILDVAKSVRITLTSQQLKGDAYDYLNGEGTMEDLWKIINSAPLVDPDDLEQTRDINKESPEVTLAKKANEKPFRNFFHTLSPPNEKGVQKDVYDPKHINDIVEDVHNRLLGFPRRVGAYQLFDHDRETHDVVQIHNINSCFGWISSKTGQIVEWSERVGMAKRGELFERLIAEAQVYESISKVPSWPRRDDVFYAHEELPAPDPDHKYFNDFVSFFNPTSHEFEIILKAFIISPIFYQFMSQKPIWVIDSEVRGSGKTTLASILAHLYDSSVIEVKKHDLQKRPQEVIKRLVAPMARSSKIVLIDNVTGVFKCDEFATLTTLPVLTERPAFGRGDEVRPNDLTYALAANDPALDDDIASRSYYFKLKRLKYSAGWGKKVVDYIKSYRLHIFADIIDILENHDTSQYDGIEPMTRCPDVETMILRPVCKDLDEYNEVVKVLMSCKNAANADKDSASELEDYFAHQIRELELSTEQNLWIRSTVAQEWFISAIGANIKGHHMQIMRGFVKDGHARNLDIDWQTYPHNEKNGEKPRRGILWRGNSSNYVDCSIIKTGKKTCYISYD